MTRVDGRFDRALDDLDLRAVTRSPVLDYLRRLLDEYRELEDGRGPESRAGDDAEKNEWAADQRG